MTCDSTRGATMVKVVTSSGSFCIDTTEVTNAQYNAFLDDAPPFNPQPAGCEGHDTWGDKVFGKDDVVHDVVTWCDAFAYCKWAGKRLCGRIGDGARVRWIDAGDPAQNEWVAACNSGSTSNVYPYGATYDPRVCNSGEGVGGADVGPPTLHPPKSSSGCHGFGAPYDAIFDMAGNIAEWENTCHDVKDFGLECATRGGFAGSGEEPFEEQCSGYDGMDAPVQWPVAGIRCCK